MTAVMINLIRRFRIAYSIYNFFQKKDLIHNEVLYKKIGLNKKYYSSISSKDFKHINEKILIPAHVPASIYSTGFFNALSAENKESILHFEENGYAIINNFLSGEKTDEVNEIIETLLKTREIKFTNVNKLMFAIHHSNLLRQIGESNALLEILSVLLQGSPLLFQSINFKTGSEQHTHSDSIHMTTFPLGGLLGLWIALDDITPENGPLHYYPGSHKLPYYLNADYDNEGSALFHGSKSYKSYEEMISKKIIEKQLEKKIFYAKKGDALIWHANLFHGGEPHTDKTKTRRSMVFHYFRKESICYHEITQRPALLKHFD